MSTIKATIDMGDDSVGVITDLLQRFPRGRRIRVELTDEPVGSAPDLVDWLSACPEKGWFGPLGRGETTDELRAGMFE